MTKAKLDLASFKASCLQENLAKGLSIVARAVNSRSTLPILGNIKIASDPNTMNRIMLQATNLEVGITCFVQGHIDADGGVTLPARSFVDLINAMPANEQVEFDVNPRTQTAAVTCGRFTNNVKGQGVDEFPIIPTCEDTLVTVGADALHSLISRVAFSAATDESRPILTGVYCEITSSGLLMAAADGFRLSFDRIVSEADVAETIKIIIPSRALAELARIMGDQTEDVKIGLVFGRDGVASQIVFSLTNITLVSQLIDGKYPDYAAIEPKTSATTIEVDGTALANACKAANVFAREAANIVRFEATFGKEDEIPTLSVQAISAESGDNLSLIDAKITGPEVGISFNVKYLTDLMKVVEKRTITIHLNSDKQPGIFTDATLPHFKHIIMPMHRDAKKEAAPVAATPAADAPPVDPTPVQNAGQDEG